MVKMLLLTELRNTSMSFFQSRNKLDFYGFRAASLYAKQPFGNICDTIGSDFGASLGCVLVDEFLGICVNVSDVCVTRSDNKHRS